MRPALRLALFAAAAASLAGCRLKGYEGFVSATTPRGDVAGERSFGESAKGADPTTGEDRSDWGKYSNGGIAIASGGLDPSTRYGLGAKPDGKPMPGYDQPQKGSGQQPGDYPNVATAGHAQTNAPAFQPSPSDVGQQKSP